MNACSREVQTIRIVLLALTLLITSCKPSGPASTETNSAGFATLAERTNFLQQYVTFKRSYESLDFHIAFHNNSGGMVPGPSDWDVRLIAKVPAAELQSWVPAGANISKAPDTSWLQSVPTTLNLSGVTEWYTDDSRMVGLDRANQIVVYRASSK